LDSLAELLEFLVRQLEKADIPYALTGSVASMSYGEPRSTRDIDVVVLLAEEHVPGLRSLFPPDAFYFDEDVAREAIREGAQFNIVHPYSGLKVDVYIPGDAIARSMVANARTRRAVGGMPARFSPPEELIVKKLQYQRMGGGERHLRDVAAMIEVSRDLIDLERVADLARTVGVSELWQQVLAQLEQP